MATKLWVGTDVGNEGDWGTAANHSPANVPVNADDVFLRNSSQDVGDTLDQSAVTLDSLTIDQTYTGEAGTDAAYFQIGATIADIGRHSGPGRPVGSGRLKLDMGAAQTAMIIHNTGSPLTGDSETPPVQLKFNQANSTLEVRKGKVGVAFHTGETSTIGTINVSYVSQVNSDADVFISSGVTLTTLNGTGGETVLECSATTVNVEGGKLTTDGSGAVTNMNVFGGEVISNSLSTITNLVVKNGGVIDFTKSRTARTVVNCKLEKGGTIKYDPDVVTFTNGILSDDPVILTAQ